MSVRVLLGPGIDQFRKGPIKNKLGLRRTSSVNCGRGTVGTKCGDASLGTISMKCGDASPGIVNVKCRRRIVNVKCGEATFDCIEGLRLLEETPHFDVNSS